MREYILTEKEKKIIRAFLDDDIQLNGYQVLKTRIKKSSSTIRKDLALIQRFWEKANE